MKTVVNDNNFDCFQDLNYMHNIVQFCVAHACIFYHVTIYMDHACFDLHKPFNVVIIVFDYGIHD